MLDYVKLWIYDKPTIANILANNKLTKNFISNEDGILTGVTSNYKNWQIKTITADCLQLAGSIHKYWNGGTNETDFPFSDVVRAIKKFCKEFALHPSFVFVKNLEFGVNLHIEINASELMEQIVCFNGKQPLRPYQNEPNCYFIEFEKQDYYFKVYDKGKQAREVWKLPNTPNTLRMEVKGMNSRFLMKCGNVSTLADLMQKQNLQALGLKFAKITTGLVFDDDTITTKQLTKHERKLYKELSNPRSWKKYQGNTDSTFNNKKQRFKTLVERKGSRAIYSTISKAISDKIIALSKNKKLANFLPNYSKYSAKPRHCLTCGKDISHQHQNSKFCGEKYVGEKMAHQCRNRDSNERNNWKRKMEKLKRRGLLFDIEPYCIGRKGKRTA